MRNPATALARIFNAMAPALLTGNYSLLLGSGASADATNALNRPLLGAEALRTDLCKLLNLGQGSPLQRAYGHLSEPQKHKYVYQRYSGCNPGITAKTIRDFQWRSVYTFNVDDVIESAYEEVEHPLQRPVLINYDDTFSRRDRADTVPIIHLHGSVRRNQSALVFSYTEYVKTIRAMNPWMVTLSSELSTEPFIIAGTSLNEIDLEYYLSFRSETTRRKGEAPSILVEPFADAGTEADCEKHGLSLVRMPLAEFLSALNAYFPARPSPADLVIPATEKLFSKQVDKRTLLSFFTDFELVRPVNPSTPSIPPQFYYGRAPDWVDLENKLDVRRPTSNMLGEQIRRFVNGSKNEPTKPIVVYLADAGDGKSTSLRRAAYDTSGEGHLAFFCRATAKLDVDAIVAILNALHRRALLFFDGVADQAVLVKEILRRVDRPDNILVLGAERNYREEFLRINFADGEYSVLRSPRMTYPELSELIENYRDAGLVGESVALANASQFIKVIANDPVAVAICRIMRDFRPLEEIVQSLLRDSDEIARARYLVAGLARYCASVGLSYSIVQSLSPSVNLATQLVRSHPLALDFTDQDRKYVVPLNATVADSVLAAVRKSSQAALLNAFNSIAEAISPFVNRSTIIQRTPEARVATRLFDFDKVASLWLGPLADDFYIKQKASWSWNSRYWEQRALLAYERDPAGGVQHAKQAVAIERHPFTLTTLGKLLFRYARQSPSNAIVDEAISVLIEAMDKEADRWRPSIHPFMSLAVGSASYLEDAGELSRPQVELIKSRVLAGRALYLTDVDYASALSRLSKVMAI